MTQPSSLSPVELRQILELRFDEEELRTLCFDLGKDYDSLRGEGKAAKARELVALAERQGDLPKLEAAIRRERPSLDKTYRHGHVHGLQESILLVSRQSISAKLLPSSVKQGFLLVVLISVVVGIYMLIHTALTPDPLLLYAPSLVSNAHNFILARLIGRVPSVEAEDMWPTH